MNPFLPPADLRAVHRRLGHILPVSVHTLLRAADPVEDAEPASPKVARPRRINPNPSRKLDTIRAQVLLALSDRPQSYHDVARETGLPKHQVKECLSQITYFKQAKNIAPSGALGLYVLTPIESPKFNRGPFDV